MRRRLGTLSFGIAVAVLFAALAIAPKLLDVAAGPDAAMQSQIRRTESDALRLSVPGASSSLTSRRHHFDRITTHIDGSGQAAYALSTLDFEGAFGSVRVSSLGVERVPFDRVGNGWRPADGFAPRLTAIVRALEERRLALENGDGQKLASLAASHELAQAAAQDEFFRRILSIERRRYRALAWYIRAERDRAMVTEDYQLLGALNERPLDEKGTRRLTLERRGSQFLFSGSLL